MSNTDEYTLDQVLQFFNYAQTKGLMNQHSARASRAVLSRVASVLDEQEQRNVAHMNWDEVFLRFKNKHAQNLSSDSLRVYKSRFLSALEAFLRYREEPGNFKPYKSAKTEQLAAKHEAQRRAQEGPRVTLPDVPVPLEGGVVVKIVGLPQDLSRQEAERFQRIIMSYIV